MKKDIINVIARKASKCSLVKIIMHKPYQAYKRKQLQKKIDNFHRNGFEALVIFDKCLSEHGYKYTLAFGSLLGAIRERDFIPHDDDIDVTMWIEDYSPDLVTALESVGFRHKCTFSVENDEYAKEDTFEFKGVLLDIFYIYGSSEKDSYCCYFEIQPGCSSRYSSVKKYGGLATRKIYLSANKDTVRVPFKGIEVPVPTNYDEVLKKVFGDNYMTPIPGWTHEDFSEKMDNWLCDYKEY